MPEWLTILLVVVGGVSGTGGLWGGARWLAGWFERRSQARHDRELELLKRKHDYEAAILTRVENLAEKFLQTNERLQARLDEERNARLNQALDHARTLAEQTELLLTAAEQMSGSSPAPKTGKS